MAQFFHIRIDGCPTDADLRQYEHKVQKALQSHFGAVIATPSHVTINVLEYDPQPHPAGAPAIPVKAGVIHNPNPNQP